MIRVTLVTSLVISFLAFTCGYFYAGSVPSIVQLQKYALSVDVRDADWHRCESVSNTQRKDNKLEQLYHCPKSKVFVIQKWRVATLDTDGQGAQ